MKFCYYRSSGVIDAEPASNALDPLLVIFEGSWWDTVHGQRSLVGLSHQHILSFFLLVEQLHKHSHHGPHLTFVQSNLTGKILGTIELCRENDVLVSRFLRGAGAKANLHLIGTSKDRLSRPLGELEAVVLELIRQDSTTLIINLFAPAKDIMKEKW